MQDIYLFDQIPHPVDLLNEAECDDDWLAPLGLGPSKPTVSQLGTDMRRVQSTPAFTSSFSNPSSGSWSQASGTAPMPIVGNPARCGSMTDINHSMESTQTVLGGSSVPERDSILIGNGSFHGPSHAGLTRFGSVPVPIMSGGMAAPHPSPLVDVMDFQPGMPSYIQTNDYNSFGVYGSAPAGTVWVPERETSPHSITPTTTTAAGAAVGVNELTLPEDFEDLGLLDEALDMVTSGKNYSGLINGATYGGSCPLPTLLEDVVSQEGGSDDSGAYSLSMDMDHFGSTWHSGHTAASRSPSLPISTTTRGPPRSAPRSVPNPRSIKSKIADSMERTVRGGAPIGMASSYPNDRDRPLRNAARRSLAVTAAALKDYDDGSDSDSDDAHILNDSSSRRSGMSISGKKKHNPWSLEETEALVHGVQLAGLGKWAEIKRLPVMTITNILANRSAVDLKDKWRNLTRVARLPKAQLKARLARSASEVPLDVMLTVKGLMENGVGSVSEERSL